MLYTLAATTANSCCCIVKAGGQRPWLVMNIGSAAPVRPARHHKENQMKCACGWHTSSPPASSATTSRSVQHIFHRADFYVHVARRADEAAEPIDWCTVARGFETFFLCGARSSIFYFAFFLAAATVHTSTTLWSHDGGKKALFRQLFYRPSFNIYIVWCCYPVPPRMLLLQLLMPPLNVTDDDGDVDDEEEDMEYS